MKRLLRHWLVAHKGNRHRPVLLQPHGFVVLTLCVAFVHLAVLAALHVPSLRSILGYATNITATDILQTINRERSATGLSPLTFNEQLAQAAQAKGQDMVARGYWSHTTPDGQQPWIFITQAGYRYRVAGENLARNFTNTSDMVEAWKASPTHRANLLSGHYSETGIAVVHGEMNGVPTTLVVQMFGAPQVAVAEVPREEAAAPPSPPVEDSGETPISETPAVLSQAPTTDTLQDVEGENTTQLAGVLTAPRTSKFSPLSLYRIGTSVVLAFTMAVLIHDFHWEKRKKLFRRVGKNLAHLILLMAVLTTLALAEAGNLL